MKARILIMGDWFPIMEIMPDNGDFHSLYGRVEIHFMDLDPDTGRYRINPVVKVNANLSNGLTPDESLEWGKCIDAAAWAAKRGAAFADIKKEYDDVWKFLDKWKAEHGQNTK